MPYQIIYSSKSATPMQMDDLEEILERAGYTRIGIALSGALEDFLKVVHLHGRCRR